VVTAFTDWSIGNMANTGNIFSLLYLSGSTVPFAEKDLRNLLDKSRENNSKLEITGMFRFKAGNFLQVLEGKKETVISLYEKIARDPRHHQITTLLEETSPQRSFPDWSMGFHDLSSSDTRSIPGFSHFLDTSLTIADLTDIQRAKKLLLLFKEEKLV
jgi:hypothetical protein